MRVAIAIVGLVGGCAFHVPASPDDTADDAVADAAPTADAIIAADAVMVTFDAVGVPDAAPDATPDATPDAMICPSGYAPLIDGSLSQYRTGGLTFWPDAEADCADDGPGTHLVVIDNSVENAAIGELAFGQLWVGVSDRVSEGDYRLVTGAAASYLVWAPLQPDNFFEEDCVVVNEPQRFVDIGCTNLHGYVCECDGIAPDPTAF